MTLYLTLVGVFAFFCSGLLRFLLGKGVVSATTSVIGPLAIFLIYFFYFSSLDPLGFWSVLLTFAIIICLFASVLGTVVASQIRAGAVPGKSN